MGAKKTPNPINNTGAKQLSDFKLRNLKLKTKNKKGQGKASPALQKIAPEYFWQTIVLQRLLD